MGVIVPSIYFKETIDLLAEIRINNQRRKVEYDLACSVTQPHSDLPNPQDIPPPMTYGGEWGEDEGFGRSGRCLDHLSQCSDNHPHMVAHIRAKSLLCGGSPSVVPRPDAHGLDAK
jgi:hypothetical protein